MSKWIIIGLLFFGIRDTSAQTVSPVTGGTEQQLENSTEKAGDIETEDDGYLQQVERFVAHPVNLNTADEADLNELKILSPIQVNALIAYRSVLGSLVDLYELQAVPGWDPATIRKIRLYIAVSQQEELIPILRTRMSGGTRSLLLRVSQVMERSRGYLVDPATGNNFYPGSPQKIFLRYTYTFRNLLQYGILAEKDPGEQFFKGRQKQGFDFYSAHFFARNLGIVRALALGDFTVNLAQGLIQWQGLAFTKSPEVLLVKRQGAVLAPYHSAGEVNFQRGFGTTLAKGRWQATFFASYKKADANLVADTVTGSGSYVSSLQNSGYHRTKSETDDKGVQRMFVFGGNFSGQFNNLHLGINAIHYRFGLPLHKPAEPYNRFAMDGTAFSNYSFDYGYTCKNMHLFGELACTRGFNRALVSGLLVSLSPAADMSLLYRNISPKYQALYANAFTENTDPVNERGLYMGIAVRPGSSWHIDGYADIFQFPWLKYRVDGPSGGSDYFVQATYTPNKQVELLTSYHSGSKSLNLNTDSLALHSVSSQVRQDWRVQFRYIINPAITLRNRVQVVWFDKRGEAPGQGFLWYTDCLFNPPLKAFSGGARIQYFESDGYNSRIYAYENDVLYSYAVPVFYDKGCRYYVNFNYDINKKLTIWIRWAQTLFSGKNLIGSGLDEIAGATRSEFKLQVRYKF